jgi:hypothetical protein
MTQFQAAIQAVKEGRVTPPRVSSQKGDVDYFWYQLCSHHFYMKIFASGMTAKQIKLKTLKTYYGLKGRSAKDCLVEFQKIKDEYKAELKTRQNSAQS